MYIYKCMCPDNPGGVYAAVVPLLLTLPYYYTIFRICDEIGTKQNSSFFAHTLKTLNFDLCTRYSTGCRMSSWFSSFAPIMSADIRFPPETETS